MKKKSRRDDAGGRRRSAEVPTGKSMPEIGKTKGKTGVSAEAEGGASACEGSAMNGQQETRWFCPVRREFVTDSQCKECPPVPACRRSARRLRLEEEFGDLPKASAARREVPERAEYSPIRATDPVAGKVEAAADPEKERQKPRRKTGPRPASPLTAVGPIDAGDVTTGVDPAQSSTPAVISAAPSAESICGDVQGHDADSADSPGSELTAPPSPGKKTTGAPLGEKVRPRLRQAGSSQPTVPSTSEAIDAPATTVSEAAPEAPTPDPQGPKVEAAEPRTPVTADAVGVDPDHPDRQDAALLAPSDSAGPDAPVVPFRKASSRSKKGHPTVPGNHPGDNGRVSANAGRVIPLIGSPENVDAGRDDSIIPHGEIPIGKAQTRREHRVSSEDAYGRKCLGQRTVLLVDIRVGEVVTRKVNSAYVGQLVEALKASKVLPPLVVDQDMHLVDGQHRLTALKKIGRMEADVVVHEYKDGEARLRHAIELNIAHGRAYSAKEKKELGLGMFDAGTPASEISQVLAVTERAVMSWTKELRGARLDDLRHQAVLMREEGKRQEEIAAALGVTRNKVRSLLGEKGRSSEITNGVVAVGTDAPTEDTLLDGTTTKMLNEAAGLLQRVAEAIKGRSIPEPEKKRAKEAFHELTAAFRELVRSTKEMA